MNEAFKKSKDMATSDRHAEIESYGDYMGVFCTELLHFFRK